jgi:hypothetical protein
MARLLVLRREVGTVPSVEEAAVAVNSEARSERSLRKVLTEWWSRHHFSDIAYRENEHPENDPAEDYYAVRFEAIFDPASLEASRIELWECDDGRVAIGFETRDRVGSRLGVRNRKQGFAVGSEPRLLSEDDILTLLEFASKGRIALLVRSFPMVGLGRIGVSIESDATDARLEGILRRLGWAYTPRSPCLARRLRYIAWTNER